MTTTLTEQNAQEHCRTCLVYLDSCLDQPQYVNVTKCENILHLIRILVESNTDDIENYPQNLCLICFRVLEEILEFRKNILKSAATLKAALDKDKLLPDTEISTKALTQQKEDVEEFNENFLMETGTVLIVESSPALEINQIDVNTTQRASEKNVSKERDPKVMQVDQAFNLFDEEPIPAASFRIDSASTPGSKFIQVVQQNDKPLSSTKDMKQNKSKTFKCDYCKASFIQLSKYLTHMREVHRESYRRYACDNCDKSYKRIKTLKKHLHLVHDSNGQRVECIDCGRLYKTEATLKQHRLNAHFIDEPIKQSKDYACEQCDASFVRVKCLANHYIAKHSPGTKQNVLKEFECSICNKYFQNRFNLENHTLRYHSKERNFVCNICGTSYARKCLLVTHMRIHCSDVEKFLCDHSFMCQQCDQRFASARTLRHHLYRHTCEKPYTCDICDKTFRQLTAMKLHRKRHGFCSNDEK